MDHHIVAHIDRDMLAPDVLYVPWKKMISPGFASLAGMMESCCRSPSAVVLP